MPVYQYACTACGEQLEVRQSFTDDALTVCPVCEGRLRKVLNAVGVVFKGSGFYRTDSRNGASTTAEAKGEVQGDAKGADSGSSSDSGSTTRSPDSSGSPTGGKSGSNGSGSGSTTSSSSGASTATR